jgi:hypothetical protein
MIKIIIPVRKMIEYPLGLEDSYWSLFPNAQDIDQPNRNYFMI